MINAELITFFSITFKFSLFQDFIIYLFSEAFGIIPMK